MANVIVAISAGSIGQAIARLANYLAVALSNFSAEEGLRTLRDNIPVSLFVAYSMSSDLNPFIQEDKLLGANSGRYRRLSLSTNTDALQLFTLS